MTVSTFEIFSIGIGPSSSHTVGPMRAVLRYLEEKESLLSSITRVKVELFGSLALTGKGHATDVAIILGLEGNRPETIDPLAVSGIVTRVHEENSLLLKGKKRVPFIPSRDIECHYDKMLPFHSNAMKVTLYNEERLLNSKIYYSIGGGFVVDHEDAIQKKVKAVSKVPYPFQTAAELLQFCNQDHLKIFEVMWENERVYRSDTEIRQGILRYWDVMQQCVVRGCSVEGILPGGLEVKRRAPGLAKELAGRQEQVDLHSSVFDYLSLWALAVNEENAASGQVVTAPTNGAAGIIPAVLHYYKKYISTYSEDGIVAFFLTASAICNLYKVGASISGAEMGCQGEVGVACSMAAAGLAEVLGGTNIQIECAAEIGMEHKLGLTCDPVGGLVQIPCIERNTMGALSAVNAARLALRRHGEQKVSLDQVISAMKEIGDNMKTIYKETSLGGLALQVGNRQEKVVKGVDATHAAISVGVTAC